MGVPRCKQLQGVVRTWAKHRRRPKEGSLGLLGEGGKLWEDAKKSMVKQELLSKVCYAGLSLCLLQ